MQQLEQTRHARRESTVRLLSLKNSGGRVLISLFARKIINPWDLVRGGRIRCEKNGRCDEENTAGGAVCTRLKGRWADSDMTPRLFSSTIDGGTKVSPASLEGSVNAMFTVTERKKAYFQVNSASPVSTARVIFSSHRAASSGGSGSKLAVEKPSSSSSKRLASTFA